MSWTPLRPTAVLPRRSNPGSRWSKNSKRPSATDEGRFDDVEGRITVYVTNAYDGFNELDITVTPIASREERLREAREKALLNASYDEKLLPRRIVEIIEGVDAEFAMVET